jgi:hypothetical protein
MTCCNGKRSGCFGAVILVLLGVWVAHAHHRRKMEQTRTPGPLIGFSAEESPAFRPPAFRPPDVRPLVLHPPVIRAPAVRSPAFTSPGGASSFAHWPPEPGDGFDADVELSPRAALQSAARQAARLAGATCADLSKVKDVSVCMEGGGDEPMADIVQPFQQVAPGATAAYFGGRMPPGERATDDHLWVTFRRIDTAHAQVPWSRMFAAHGSVEASVIGPAGTRTVSVRFDEKPWAVDLSAFAAADRGRQWVVGQSDRPCATPDEAERNARADAARQLAVLVEQAHFANGRTPGDPIGRAEAAVAGGRFVADRLTRRFHRDYGDVWYDAVLVDASPANLQALADETAGLARARRASFVARVASGAAMVAVIFIIYVVVNAFTRGYFVWRLRAATALVLVVALGALLLIAAMG